MEDELAAGLRDVPGICLVTDGEVQALYPVRDYYDAYSDEVARAPFTELYFTALGTLVARKIHALLARPYKVIVLDCDETLWLGACGDGAGEIRVDPARRFLQQFMVAQRDAGMLLCLCSKNNPEDVFEAFRRHPDMPLRPEHLVSFRVNWRSKSENLKALAGELQLATDSFIFIDDSTFECAEVRANCPDVLVLQLPESDRIERFLRQSWAFDHVTRTDADKGRSERVRTRPGPRPRARIRRLLGRLPRKPRAEGDVRRTDDGAVAAHRTARPAHESIQPDGPSPVGERDPAFVRRRTAQVPRRGGLRSLWRLRSGRRRALRSVA